MNNIKEDLKAVRRSGLEDLNQDKLTNYLQNIKENKPNLAKFSDEKILELSGIITKSDDTIYPTLAGMMIFGLYPQGYFPQLFVACCQVPGKKLGDLGEVGQRFDDNKRVEGTIEEMLQGTLSFLRKNMKNKVVINPKTGIREDIPEYPMNALREAVANALIHRDYNITGAYIQVYMYDDRIEILSPGSLYGTNKIKDLGENKMMEIRNETILRILEEYDSFVENRHTGIPTMKEEMKKAGLPEPIFEEDRNSFRVTFKNSLDSYTNFMEDKSINLDTSNTSSKISVFKRLTSFFY